MTILWVFLVGLAMLLALLVLVFSVEIVTSLTSKSVAILPIGRRSPELRIAVLIPANNEEDGIGETVSNVVKQLNHADRLIVVADNCTDATAERAREAGATAICRYDPTHRGKGYALAFGVKHLVVDPPDVVVIVDADSKLEHGSLDALAACSHRTQRAAQAKYTMSLPTASDTLLRIASFAWVVKNHMRPMGLASLGLPCQLMGTGMAIPWEAICRINLTTSSLVEDVEMGLELAATGFPPIYCHQAKVESTFPVTERGFATQRRRWETGSLRVLFTIAPSMLLRGLLTRNIPLVAMAVDQMVPPTMMFVTALGLGFAVCVLAVAAGGPMLPAWIFGASLSTMVASIFLAWFAVGRSLLGPRDLLNIPSVVARKLTLYMRMWQERGVGWLRTDRK